MYEKSVKFQTFKVDENCIIRKISKSIDVWRRKNENLNLIFDGNYSIYLRIHSDCLFVIDFAVVQKSLEYPCHFHLTPVFRFPLVDSLQSHP